MDSTVVLNPAEKLIDGVNTLADAVKSTLGPKGRFVIIEEPYKRPTVTKDGVTVAKAVTLADTEQLGVEILRQAANQTVDKAGDGTTTAIVLAQAIVKEGHKLVQAGVSPISIKRGIEKALPIVVEMIKQQSTPIKKDIKKIKEVATISANNDLETGSLIAQAFDKATTDGIISVRETDLPETTITEVTGTQFDSGWMSPYFVTNREKLTAEYEDAFVLVFDGKLRNPDDLVPLFDQIIPTGKATLIIANEIEPQVLRTLIINRVQAQLKVVPVIAARHGEHRKKLLEDIAVLTGGRFITGDLVEDLKSITLDDLGTCNSFTVSQKETTITDGHGLPHEIEERIEVIKAEISNATNPYLKDQSQSRLARMIGGVVLLNVGAQTKSELREKLDRIDDALHATKAAIKEGVLPGGGKALLTVADAFDLEKLGLEGEEKLGAKVLLEALKSPMATIAENAGVSPDVVVNKSSNSHLGYNALTDKYQDMFKAGIIDPTLVVHTALETAVSVAVILLMTNCAIHFNNKPEPGTPELMNQH
jgi:chaperonin GroEL